MLDQKIKTFEKKFKILKKRKILLIKYKQNILYFSFNLATESTFYCRGQIHLGGCNTDPDPRSVSVERIQMRIRIQGKISCLKLKKSVIPTKFTYKNKIWWCVFDKIDLVKWILHLHISYTFYSCFRHFFDTFSAIFLPCGSGSTSLLKANHCRYNEIKKKAAFLCTPSKLPTVQTLQYFFYSFPRFPRFAQKYK